MFAIKKKRFTFDVNKVDVVVIIIFIIIIIIIIIIVIIIIACPYLSYQ